MKKLTLLLAPLALVASACAGQQAAKKPTPRVAEQKPAAQAAPAPAKQEASTGGSVALGKAPDQPIYFDFDSEQLRPESQKLLQEMAEYLRQNPDLTITIAGHCDDTGSSEYNLALGDKRARAAREYLERLGIQGQRIQTISYGEEKPAVDDITDEARAKNRRDEFDLVKKGNKEARAE